MQERYKFRPRPGPVNSDLDNLVIELWNTGKYTFSSLARQIALQGGPEMTRSQIGGKLNRAEARGVTIRRPGGPKNITESRSGKSVGRKRRPPSGAPRGRPKVVAAAKVEASPPPPAPPPKAAEPYDGPYTLGEVSAKNTCRYPIGDRPNVMFCGRKRAAHSEAYCAQHHEKCHSKHFHAPEDRRIPASLR